ncbi:hypothetical protein [Cryptosporangium japonicum]
MFPPQIVRPTTVHCGDEVGDRPITVLPTVLPLRSRAFARCLITAGGRDRTLTQFTRTSGEVSISMNIWIRRSLQVGTVSAGIVLAGAAAAQAQTGNVTHTVAPTSVVQGGNTADDNDDSAQQPVNGGIPVGAKVYDKNAPAGQAQQPANEGRPAGTNADYSSAPAGQAQAPAAETPAPAAETPAPAAETPAPAPENNAAAPAAPAPAAAPAGGAPTVVNANGPLIVRPVNRPIIVIDDDDDDDFDFIGRAPFFRSGWWWDGGRRYHHRWDCPSFHRHHHRWDRDCDRRCF